MLIPLRLISRVCTPGRRFALSGASLGCMRISNAWVKQKTHWTDYR